MKLILLGAPGAGTDLGKEAKGFMDAGDLVPDTLIMNIMASVYLKMIVSKAFCSMVFLVLFHRLML